MKKIISLLLVTVMMCTFAFSVNAADLTKGINVNFVEDENGLITTTVSGVGLEKLFVVFMGIKFDTTKVSLLHSDKTTSATTSSTYSNVVEGLNATYNSWANHVQKIGTNYITINDGGSTATDNLNCTTSTDLYKIYFKKVEGATIDASTFTIYYKTAGGQTGYQENGSSKVKANVDGTFGFTVTPYSKPAVDKWEAATSTDMPSAWTAPDALDGEVRRVTVFGKNATSKALAANSYGVTFGDNTYYGIATDTAVQYWAIVIVDTEGNKITSGNTYNGTAFVGTETWSVSVSAD